MSEHIGEIVDSDEFARLSEYVVSQNVCSVVSDETGDYDRFIEQVASWMFGGDFEYQERLTELAEPVADLIDSKKHFKSALSEELNIQLELAINYNGTAPRIPGLAHPMEGHTVIPFALQLESEIESEYRTDQR